MERAYLSLERLKVYQLARELSRVIWEIYQTLDWQDKKTMGNQLVGAGDSVGANIAEGFGRFHFLDKVKFYFNARGSLLESRHWLDLLSERKKIVFKLRNKYLDCYKNLRPALNGLINSTMREKEKSKK